MEDIPVADNKIIVRDASEEFFGGTQGKLVTFKTEETRKGFFSWESGFLFWRRKHRDETLVQIIGEILVQVAGVRPEGGKDCWTFKGQVLSRKGPIAHGILVEGFYRGPNGNTDPGWRDNVSTDLGQVKTGWIKPAA